MLHFDPKGEVLEAARDCEAAVFLRQYGNTAEQWAEEYGRYDPSSAFIAITDPHGDAIAALRLVLPGPLGLKSLVDVARPPWQIDGARAARAAGMVVARTWDVATLAVRPGARSGGLLSAALYHALFRATRANRIRWIVMILDVRVRRLLTGAHIDTQVLPGTRAGAYLGSAASVPLWGEMARMADRQRQTNPDAHRLINLGIGLDGIVLPDPDGYVLGRRPTGIDQPALPAIHSVGRASA
ncbi:MAG TPA: hypothetical protein VGH43_21105 [Jatrophihabitans sp.]|jgi:hypothetical protein